MADKQGNQIKITIFGQEYSVKAPADPEYIKKIAKCLDGKMREVQSGFNSTQSSNRISILASMNITDELFSLAIFINCWVADGSLIIRSSASKIAKYSS